MSPEERVAYENRVRTRQVVLAALAGVFVMLAVLIQIGGPQPKVTEDTLKLVVEHQRFTRDLIASIISAIGLLALAWTLWYLWGCTRFRDPAVKPSFIGGLAVAGCVLSAVSVVAFVIAYGTQAHDFVSHGSQTYPQANALLSKTVIVVPQILIDLSALLIAVGLVMVSLSAMRVGLLTRFLGYVGIIAGVFTIIPLVPIPIVEAYWLLALAYLFSGRWPGAVPPAWSTGRAERWPARQRPPAREPLLGRGRGRARPAPAPAPPEPVATPAAGNTRSATPKRKRKRRK
jgi:hypothetical protein